MISFFKVLQIVCSLNGAYDVDRCIKAHTECMNGYFRLMGSSSSVYDYAFENCVIKYHNEKWEPKPKIGE